MRLLWVVDRRQRSLSKQMQDRTGVSAPQRLALRMVGRRPHVVPSVLAELLHLGRGPLSGILERPAAQHLVMRKPHPEAGRSGSLHPSSRGRGLDEATAGTVEAGVRQALASLPRSGVDAARQLLEAVARELLVEGRRSFEPGGAD